MAEKLSGMEMALKSLLKVAGFDAGEVAKQMGFVVNEMQQGLRSTVERMTGIEKEQKRTLALLEHICRELKIAPLPAGEILPPVPLSNGEIHPDN